METKHDWRDTEFPGVIALHNEAGSKRGYVASPGLDTAEFPVAGTEDLHGVLFTARRMGQHADVQLFADLERAKAWVERGKGIHHKRDREAANEALRNAGSNDYLYEARRLSALSLHKREEAERRSAMGLSGLAVSDHRRATEFARLARFAWDRWTFLTRFGR